MLAVGGQPGTGAGPLSTAELYDPSTGEWTTTDSLPESRFGQSAVLLPDGAVLIAGGCAGYCNAGPDQTASYLYSDGFWGPTGSLPAPRFGQSAIGLADGDVLMAGGEIADSADAAPSTDLYIPPLITASPDSAAAGGRVNLIGNGFYAGETVSVTLSGPAGQRGLTTVKAGSKGQFKVPVTVPDVRPGTYQLAAQGQTSYAYATGNFVVEKG